MTSVGHTLVGIAIGTFCVPPEASTRWKARYFVAFMVLPNVPDLPFPFWGHDRYDISHSLVVNLLLCLILLTLLTWHPHSRRSIGSGKVLGGGMCAWLSHLVLDSFYNHGRGVAIFWPVSDA